MKPSFYKTILHTILFFSVVLFASCSNDDKDDNLNNQKQHLIKQSVITYASSGSRYFTDYVYDNEKRLIGYNDGNYTFNYNTGGLLISYKKDNYSIDMQFSFTNGNVSTLRYTSISGSTRTDFLSTFYYDSKGRLIRIFSKELNLPDGYAWTNNYLYKWDDNNNLIEEKNEFSRKPDGTIAITYITTYSGFDPSNINTVGATNFGFNYFGLYSYPTKFTPTADGSSLKFLNSAFSGKLLPSKITEGDSNNPNARTYELTYQKNQQNLITRIDKKDVSEGSSGTSEIYDFSYQ